MVASMVDWKVDAMVVMLADVMVELTVENLGVSMVGKMVDGMGES
jgi:hypothetical protein